MSGLGNHDLRAHRIGFAGMDAAYASRLSQHVSKAWHSRHARGRRGAD